MDERAWRRITGQPERRPDPRERSIAERRDHQFTSSIGGDSANYREPKFGSGPPSSSFRPPENCR